MIVIILLVLVLGVLWIADISNEDMYSSNRL